jgi:hypothetical protein
MKIRNGIQETNEVRYEGDLGGESISIALVDNDPSTNTQWLILVDVQIAQGRYFLGGFTTNTPAQDGSASRIVGFASCPGATGWFVRARNQFTSSNREFDAELFVQGGKCCGAGQFGVWQPPQPPGTGGETGGGGFTPPLPPG